ncbi:MAG: mannose-1-phosphate guanylyltransferase [Myxococcaceae bacterium]|nr:mannose-1-phosphate guanylyltransferase [Myxococcaceae bacterium]
MAKLYPVIMAGGSGTRFWPLSRQKRPKQFLSLATDAPLIVETARRLGDLATAKQTWVVCGKAHAPTVKKLLKGIPPNQVLVEPIARNTAPAIALAAAHVAKKDPTGVIAVLPSDHHIARPDAFRRALARAAKVAEEGAIVTLGIRPTRPDTGYGYIRVGEVLGPPGPKKEAALQPHKVAAFVEKPDRETAVGYLRSDDYLWNVGIFVFRADVMLAAFEQHMPELHAGLSKIRAAIGTSRYARVLSREFPKLPSISIDYGVAEKAANMAVVPGDFGWSDVGSFSAIHDVRAHNPSGNVVTGKHTLAIDTTDSVILGGDRAIAVIGMHDVVVVDAGDAVLVVPRDRAQDVRKAVDALKARRLHRFL